jgi:hypothetical protein
MTGKEPDQNDDRYRHAKEPEQTGAHGFPIKKHFPNAGQRRWFPRELRSRGITRHCSTAVDGSDE